MKVIQGNLNTDFLKLIGILTMTIDHIGKVFYYDIVWFQIIGRVTFPLFAYCLVVGFLLTSDIQKYCKRLALFAIFSQPFYIWAFEYSWYELNIFFTLLLGLISINLISKRKWLLYLILLIACAIPEFDYGIQGVLLINFIYILRNNRVASLLLLIVHFSSLLFIDLNEIVRTLILNQHLEIKPSPSLNVFGMIALLFMYVKMGLNFNKIERSFFYIFYPGHLFSLILVKNIVSLLSI